MAGGSPEDKFYDGIKRKSVRLGLKVSEGEGDVSSTLLQEVTLVGVLEWVDKFSIGIRVNGHKGSHVRLVMKGALAWIEPLEEGAYARG